MGPHLDPLNVRFY